MRLERICLVVREDAEKHPVLKSIINYFISLGSEVVVHDVREGLKCKSRTYDFVIVSDPLVYLLWVSLFRNSRNILFFSLEMFEHQVPGRGLRNKLRNSIFHIAHFLTLKNCYSVFPNEIRRDYYLNKKWTKPARSTVAYNFPSQRVIDASYRVKEEISKPNARTALLSSLNLDKDKKLYIYAGAVDKTSRGAMVIIEAFKNCENSALIIVGRDNDDIFSKESVFGRHNVFYLGQKQQHEVVKLLWGCDYGIAYYSSDVLNTKYCAPVKLYEYSLLELPLICNKNEGVVSVWGDYCFYYEDSSSLTHLIQKLELDTAEHRCGMQEIGSFERQLGKILRFAKEQN